MTEVTCKTSENEKREKIAVIYTGGTIGSTADEKEIACGEKPPLALTQLYEQKHPGRVSFSAYEPYRILSENLEPEHWKILMAEIEKAATDSDGIIITHGSDTLLYTAAFLSLFYGSYEKPIVLVASNYVLTDARANGWFNFDSAVNFILQKRGSGVFVAYANTLQECFIHKGHFLGNTLNGSDRIYSIQDKWLGKYLPNGDYVENPAFTKRWETPAVPALGKEPEEVIIPNQIDSVLYIKSMPGMAYPELPEKTKAVLIEGYHSGTIGISESLKVFAQKACDKEIPIYVTGLSGEELPYETVQVYRELGIVPLSDTAPIFALFLLWIFGSEAFAKVVE